MSTAAAPAPAAAPVATAEPVDAPAGATSLATAPPQELCANCGAPVTGRYCGACGQRLEPPLHTLWHFMSVAAEDLTHADSRIWRTLAALLFRPGSLTAEFIRGRRARYLPPVRLYLVLSVVFFLWLDAAHTSPQVLTISTSEVHRTDLSEAVRELDRAASESPEAAASLAAARRALAAAQAPATSPAQAPATGAAKAPEKVYSPFSPARPGETAEQRTGRLCRNMSYDGPWQERVRPLLSRACPRIVADNGRALGEAYLHNVPRAMFLFLPLLAAAMRLMYWRPPHYYVEHLLLLVHNHAFVFLIVLLGWPLSALLPVGGSWLRTAVVLYIPWYMYRSMRVVYGQGRALTLGKLAGLSFFYLVSGGIMLVLTVVYSVLTL